MRGVALVESLRQDLGYAIRALRKSPGFSVVAIASLALAIGANTTIFSFVNAILLRPLPYPAPDRLVVLREERVAVPARPLSVHPAEFLEWRARAALSSRSRSCSRRRSTCMGPTAPNRCRACSGHRDCSACSASARRRPRLYGRRHRGGGPPVVVLGHGFWRRRFGGDPGVVGRRLRCRTARSPIVGVAPAGFRIGSTEPDVVHAARDRSRRTRRARIARLRMLRAFEARRHARQRRAPR